MAAIIVFGAGLVGSAIALNLKKSGHKVSSVDLDAAALHKLEKKGVLTLKQDFSDPQILAELLKDQDLVIGAAPGSLGFRLMEQVILNGKNMVDISFCPEDFMELDTLAREKGVTLVADMGVAPGMCNAILGYHNSQMEVQSYKCIVGGLPDYREWPLEYKSSWSPIDCIEEYVRPARFRQNGKEVVKEALSDLELVEIPGIGSLEEWNSDGLRSLLKTLPHIPDMVEKTLRYPGTTSYIKALRELGFFSYESIDLNGQQVRPIDLTASLLFPKWKLGDGEGEFTVMRVSISGLEDGSPLSYDYDLLDRYDPVTDTLSMSRTTGYTACGVAELILGGRLVEKGVLAPEHVGACKDNFEFLLNYLEERNINYTMTRK